MKVIREEIEHHDVLTEQDNRGNKNLYLQGIFIKVNEKNKNNRIYPEQNVNEEIERYVKENINFGNAWGELDHPNELQIKLQRVSHRITELKKDGNYYVGKALIINSPVGNAVRGLIESGGRLGMSTRGIATLKQLQSGIREVQSDFKLFTAADIVADPSVSDAFVDSIMESKEWIYVDGKFIEQDIENAKENIQKATAKNVKKVTTEEYIKFINSINIRCKV